ncbi:MAG: dTDP-4-dehydrorhamnose reductase [Bacteroidota bacterium]|nr:MAG: dTDP-4-dehydrorhamnose reductase [Bacteroidota bacterium]
MSRIIVTGANGQLGSEIKKIEKKYPSFTFIYTDIDSLDLTDASLLESFILAQKPDYLINCAAYTAVDKAEQDVKTAELVNARVPGMLGLLANKYRYHIVHISTDYVFSGEFYRPLTESDPTQPASSYGKTKLEGERLLMLENEAIILRTSWLYSAFGNNFVKSMLRLGAERKELGVVFDQTGTPTAAGDLADAIMHIISNHQANKEWHAGVYHFSNEGVCSWYDFAFEIMAFAGLNCKVKPILTREYQLPAPRPAYSVLDKTRIKNTFKLEIPYWKESLYRVLEELKITKATH